MRTAGQCGVPRRSVVAHNSVALFCSVALTLIVFAAPAFTQRNSTNAQEGSAGGQADVPAVKGPGLDQSRVGTEGGAVQQAPPDLQHQGPVPIGRTDKGRAAKDRIDQ